MLALPQIDCVLSFPNIETLASRTAKKSTLNMLKFMFELQISCILLIQVTGLQRLLYKASNLTRFIGNYRTAEQLTRRKINLFKDINSKVKNVRDLFAA